jgi:hypothetical protein
MAAVGLSGTAEPNIATAAPNEIPISTRRLLPVISFTNLSFPLRLAPVLHSASLLCFSKDWIVTQLCFSTILSLCSDPFDVFRNLLKYLAFRSPYGVAVPPRIKEGPQLLPAPKAPKFF